MANVLNRTTKEHLKSVDTSNYSIVDWIINPVLPDCDPDEWVINGNTIRETTQTEKDIKLAEKEEQKRKEQEAKEREDKEREDKKIADKIEFDALNTNEQISFLYNKLT